MEISTIIALVLNGLFALMILFGFLIGFKRGWKKATLRFGILIAFIVVIAIVSPYITKAILNIQVESLGQSIFEYIKTNVVNALGDLSQLDSLVAYIDNIIVLVANLVVFLALNVVGSIISLIVYQIIAKICFKKVKAKVLTEQDKSMIRNKDMVVSQRVVLSAPKKDHTKWFGGLAGIVHAFVIMFVLMLPISGVVNMVIDITSQTATESTTELAVEGETASTEEMPETLGDFIKQNVNMPEVWEYLGVYQHSAMPTISGIFNFDDICFDSIASMNVDGQKVVLRQDVLSVNTIYNKSAPLYNKFYVRGEDWSNISLDEISDIVDTMFDITTIRALANDGFDYAYEQILAEGAVNFGEYDAEIKQLITDLYNSYKEYDCVLDGVKQDIHIMIDIAKIIQDNDILSEIYDDIESNEITGKEMIKAICALFREKPNNDGQTVSDIIIDKIFTSERVEIILNFGIKMAANFVNDGLELSVEDKIVISDSVSITSQSSDIKKIVNVALDNINEIVNSDFSNISTIDFTCLGKIINAVKECSYNINTTDNTITEKTNSIFLPFYKSAVNYLCNLQDYGSVISNIAKDSDGNIKNINWENLTSLINAGVALQDGINAENVSNLLDAIRENPELAENATDFVGAFMGEGTTLTTEQETAIDNLVGTLISDDLSEEDYAKVSDTLTAINDIVTNEESTVVASDVSDLINNLASVDTTNSNLAQEIVDAVEIFAGEGGITVSEANQEVMNDILSGITDADLQAQLRDILNIPQA